MLDGVVTYKSTIIEQYIVLSVMVLKPFLFYKITTVPK